MIPILLVALGGCAIVDAVNDLKEKIGELTSPVVVQGVVLHLEMPEDALLAAAVADAQVEVGTTGTFFVADASNADELDQAIAGATVTVQGVQATEGDPGIFSIWPSHGLEYRAGAKWTVSVALPGDDATRTIGVELPPPAPIEVPEEHTPGVPLELDFRGLGYDSALVYVFDADGAVTWTNQPATALDVFDLTQSIEAITTLEIPGAAFPGESIYAVAVAGMRHSTDGDVQGMNTFLSNLVAGQMDMYPVFTSPGLVSLGQLVDLPEPEDRVLKTALERAELDVGTTATVFLADALADVDTLDEAALPGGAVTIAGNVTVDAVDEGDGFYTVLPEDGLVWQVGATWSIAADWESMDGTTSVVLPDAPTVVVPEEHQAGQELVVDLTGQPFDSATLFVVDSDGVVVFSNEPETMDQMADIVAAPPPLGPVVVPGEAFAGPGLVGVGIAGFVHAPTDTFTGVNPELSAVLAGRVQVVPVRILP